MEQANQTQPAVGAPPSAADQHAPRYASLSDYLRVVRRRKWWIIASTVVFGVLAAGISLNQEKTYEATAQITFRDPLQGLNILPGVDFVPDESPVVRTAAQAELITRPEITRRVRRKLDTDLNADELALGIETQIGVQTNLVSLKASFGDPEVAARVANAYAEVVQDRELKDALADFDAVQDSIREQIQAVQERDLNEGLEALEVAPLQQSLRQVQTAEVTAEPVTIAKRAEVPTGPASPATRRNTALGLILGFVFGLIAAFVRDMLDRRLHSVHHIHEATGLPILSRVPHTALGFAGLSRSSSLVMADSDFEAFRALRMNLGAFGSNPSPRSVLVTSALDQEGKSSVSMALASAAALAEQRVLLVECDLRRPVFARRLNVNRQPGLSDYLVGDASPPEILQTVELRPPRIAGDASDAVAGTMVVIAAGKQVPNPAELLVGARFRDFLEKTSKAYDLVVIDSSPMLAVVDPLEIAPRVDAILVCVRLGSTTRDQARAARSVLASVDRPIGAVATGLRRGDPDSYDYYYGY